MDARHFHEVRAPPSYRDSSPSMKKAENVCETMCSTQGGSGISPLTQPLPEDSEKRSRRALSTEGGASLYCTGTQSQDFASMFSGRFKESSISIRVTRTIPRRRRGLAGDRHSGVVSGRGSSARFPVWMCPWRARSGESRGEQAQGLVLVSRQG